MTNFNFNNQSNQSVSIEERLRNYLDLDPDNLFWTTHIENHPEASFAVIAIQLIDQRTWQQISASLDGIPIRTLAEFYQDCVRRFYQDINDYLNNNNPDNSNLSNDNENF